eukprot:Opistho-1_new@56984
MWAARSSATTSSSTAPKPACFGSMPNVCRPTSRAGFCTGCSHECGAGPPQASPLPPGGTSHRSKGAPMSSAGRPPDYAELHCISSFSFLRGASNPDELVTRAFELGYTHVLCVDT